MRKKNENKTINNDEGFEWMMKAKRYVSHREQKVLRIGAAKLCQVCQVMLLIK